MSGPKPKPAKGAAAKGGAAAARPSKPETLAQDEGLQAVLLLDVWQPGAFHVLDLDVPAVSRGLMGTTRGRGYRSGRILVSCTRM